MSLVSVLIVCHNQAHLLRQTLDALSRRANPEGAEILVVDLGSRDGSGQLDEEFPEVNMLRIPRNCGWTKAVNIGTRTAKGDYLFLLPVGCLVEPDTIDRLVEALQADSKLGAVCPMPVDAAYQLVGEWPLLPKPGLLHGRQQLLPGAAPVDVEYPQNQPVLFARGALVGMNYLPEKYGQYFADAEFYYRLRQAGKRIVMLTELPVRRDVVPPSGLADDLAEADQLNGLSVFLSKNYGSMTGIKLWLGATLKALFSFRFGLFSKLAGGIKVDGSQ